MIRRMYPLASGVVLFSSAAIAHSHFDYGRVWQEWEDGDRVTWLWGAAEGQSLIIEELPESVEQLETRLPADSADMIADIMTQLYEDAANTYTP